MTTASVRLILGMLASLTFSAPASWACSCIPTVPATCPQLKEVGPIFVGTVIDIVNPPDERRSADQSGVSRYRFRVDENISGVEVTQVDIYSGRGGADCSYHFQLEETYLVFSHQDEGRLFATICSDTQPAAGTEPLLSELRARRDGKRYASVYGVLRRTQQPYGWTSYDDYDRPLPDIAVELRGANQTVSTQTDKNGAFRFFGVPPDTYHFGAALPISFELGQTILSGPPPPITLPENACYRQDLDVLPTGRIRGRIIGPDGTPLKNGDVALFRDDRYVEGDMGWWEFQDEKNWYFEFEHVTPGKYVIVFHNSNRSDPDIPYPRTFYPSAPDFKTALPVTVGEGQQVLNADIHVPNGPPTRPLIVRVRWTEDPTPVDVDVIDYQREGSEPTSQRLSPGVFKLTLFRGVLYTVFAEQDCGVRWEGNTAFPIGVRQTERVEVDGSDSRTTEITLVLQDKTCKPYK